MEDVLPDLECEVQINEYPDNVPQPLNIKAEKIKDIKTNSIESAEESMLVKQEKEASHCSSANSEEREDKLEHDLAEFESETIGEHLEREEASDNGNDNGSGRCNTESTSNENISRENNESRGKEKHNRDASDTQGSVTDSIPQAMSTKDHPVQKNISKETAVQGVRKYYQSFGIGGSQIGRFNATLLSFP